ncbi:hypothetical protein CON65_22320 [Bacillus pseudomycoides]|uniref:DUF3953 domain-containing protein n=1 Tax=Bacillus pseudomycoides TaxID=64104 RepID=A0AA91ZSC4_9BACI|nr:MULTISPECIES: hypothetical protein [Bacillus]PEB51156.1 hypothetical protein COO03_18420 [Bacillus sp. AFS098217]PED80498.1 hypothetical protein CON65_22320 [Bacillus pseudomycoides]PEU16566.1 hypothetical protein CN524_04270 [Bacillus sp. AFS019443]PEU18939.1 hypothetical protein CN525_09270 [Bacillus sp. AFS014408]PFW65331.1 hypothetical protein COL20_01010 [Bacillus sp. AFS075034]
MLAILRIFFVLLTLALCIYSLSTNNFALSPYIQLGLSCTFILTGINEIKAGRKSMSIPYFGISALMFFIMISNIVAK